MTEHDNEDPTTADKYDRAVEAIERPVIDLIEYTRRTRRVTGLLAISLVIDLVLSVVLGLVAVDARTTAALARAAIEGNHASCETTNAFKQLDLKRWQYIINLTAKNSVQGTSAAQKAAKAQTAAFVKFINEADKPVKCADDTPTKAATLRIPPVPTMTKTVTQRVTHEVPGPTRTVVVTKCVRENGKPC